MSNHLALRSGNPALQSSTFNKKFIRDSDGTMTLNGTVNKTGISLLIVLISAAYTWVTPAMHSFSITSNLFGFYFCYGKYI